MPRPLLFLTAFLVGCGNPCQDVCVEMARYADECGLTVTRDDILLCKEAEADVSDADADACKDYRDPDSLREWWTCDDLAENYQNGGSVPAE